MFDYFKQTPPQHLIPLIWKIILLLLYEPATNAC